MLRDIRTTARAPLCRSSVGRNYLIHDESREEIQEIRKGASSCPMFWIQIHPAEWIQISR